MAPTDALIVFAKRPVPGEVKTRLLPALSAEEAAALYEAFLRDALAAYRRLDVALRLYLSPPAAALPEGLVPEGVSVHWQQGDGLGARMERAFVETFAAGAERAVIIGTDHPTLPLAFVAEAFARLEGPEDVTIGPSDDGGYYLLGMRDFHPQLFRGMTYSHDRVFEETLARVPDGATPVILPLWYDVDTPESLARARAELAADAAIPAPATRAALGRLGRRPAHG